MIEHAYNVELAFRNPNGLQWCCCGEPAANLADMKAHVRAGTAVEQRIAADEARMAPPQRFCRCGRKIGLKAQECSRCHMYRRQLGKPRPPLPGRLVSAKSQRKREEEARRRIPLAERAHA